MGCRNRLRVSREGCFARRHFRVAARTCQGLRQSYDRNLMNDCLICVDTGTTNTRVWLTVGEELIASARASVGVRDTARDCSPARLHEALRELIARVRAEAASTAPRAVLAAGMI